jgi:hypothetical protein
VRGHRGQGSGQGLGGPGVKAGREGAGVKAGREGPGEGAGEGAGREGAGLEGRLGTRREVEGSVPIVLMQQGLGCIVQ